YYFQKQGSNGQFDFSPPYKNFNRKVNMHLKKIRFKTRVTPNLVPLDGAANILGANYDPENENSSETVPFAAWILSGTDEPFQFNIIGTDQDNNEVTFAASGIFVSQYLGEGGNPTSLDTVINKYNTANNTPNNPKIREIDLAGQKMALAPSTPGKKGDTTFETNKITLHTFRKSLNGLAFNPFLLKANAVVSAVSELMDLEGGVDLVPNIVPNGSDLFAFVESALSMNFEDGAEKGGGIATPNLNINALTKKLGPVGGIVEGVANQLLDNIPKFNIDDFFQGADPKLFGSISISEILKVLGAVLDAEKGPQLLQEKLPDKLQIKYLWEPELPNYSFAGFDLRPDNRSHRSELLLV
ncbi:MAG: hypothetical protein AAFU60_17560, partial [Bacteroidota bacterium]